MAYVGNFQPLAVGGPYMPSPEELHHAAQAPMAAAPAPAIAPAQAHPALPPAPVFAPPPGPFLAQGNRVVLGDLPLNAGPQGNPSQGTCPGWENQGFNWHNTSWGSTSWGG
ncbi:unnamed protein product [Ostreobium quekettii]|uniref:DAZ-associated protein 2 n=1 Tax=Ostreobium quekettii TaxID=121088 RepID=A0A8S1IQP3_9CHLO|nr:unnamed protein product [Ostreobium quekettii]